MNRIDRNSRRTWRLIWVTAFLSLLCTAAVHAVLTNAARAAADQQTSDASSQPSDELPSAIKDDPTIAPDSEESADNNVSFPVDI